MADSTANNGTVFHTHTLQNGLQIVGQPMLERPVDDDAVEPRSESGEETVTKAGEPSRFLRHQNTIQRARRAQTDNSWHVQRACADPALLAAAHD